MMRKLLIEYVPGLLGGAVGGFLGYLAVGWMLSHTPFWVPILPGAFAGLACGQLSAVASMRRGVINGLSALMMTIYGQWKLFDPPFEYDQTFPSYLAHIHQLPWLTVVVFAINGLIAFWWGRERRIGSIRDVMKPTARP